MMVAMGTWGPKRGEFMGNPQMGWCNVSVGVNGDKLAGESGDADLLIKIDVLPFCFKCN